MSTLTKKLFHDIRLNLAQFITIFLMVLLGVGAFAGVHSYMDGMSDSGDAYYKANNLQDLSVTGENFSESDLDDIKDISGVKNAERKLTVSTKLKGHGEVTLETNFIESNKINEFAVTKGKKFDKDSDGVWFDEMLAANLKLDVGDKIKFTYQGETYEKEIEGLIMVPDHVYYVKDETTIFPTHKDFGFIYMSSEEIPGGMQVYNSVMVDVDKAKDSQAVLSDIEDDIDAAQSVTERESMVSYQGLNNEIEEGRTYSVVFSFLFLFIASLSVVTTMKRFVERQKTQIGTLKALGIRRSRITRHYISFGFWISLAAVVCGTIIGPLTIGKVFINMIFSYFAMPEYSLSIRPIVYTMGASCVVLITLITWLAVRRILARPAAESLRTDEPHGKTGSFAMTSGPLRNLSLTTKWNIRDILRSKGRSIMAIAGICGCTMLIVCALGMLNTMNSYFDLQFGGLQNFDYKVALDNDYTDAEYESITDDYGEASSETLPIVIRANGHRDENVTTVTDAGNKLRFVNHDSEYIKLNSDGVYITEKLAEKLEVEKGDEIEWNIMGDDEKYTSKIAGLNRDPQSQQMTMTRSYFEDELDLTYRADTLYTNADLKGEKEPDGVSTIQNISTMRSGMTRMMETMMSFVYMLIGISVVLAAVIIYNLGTLSFNEKHYQFATLKVLGFRNKVIKRIFTQQNNWLCIIAAALGLPLGYAITDYIFKAALAEEYDFPIDIEPTTYVISFVGMVVASYLVNKFFARKVRKVDMVSSLKANE